MHRPVRSHPQFTLEDKTGLGIYPFQPRPFANFAPVGMFRVGSGTLRCRQGGGGVNIVDWRSVSGDGVVVVVFVECEWEGGFGGV